MRFTQRQVKAKIEAALVDKQKEHIKRLDEEYNYGFKDGIVKGFFLLPAVILIMEAVYYVCTKYCF